MEFTVKVVLPGCDECKTPELVLTAEEVWETSLTDTIEKLAEAAVDFQVAYDNALEAAFSTDDDDDPPANEENICNDCPDRDVCDHVGDPQVDGNVLVMGRVA